VIKKNMANIGAIPGRWKMFRIAYFIISDYQNEEIEFLNQEYTSGVTLYVLKVKEGVMLLRILDCKELLLHSRSLILKLIH
jgi:hypothetical protein